MEDDQKALEELKIFQTIIHNHEEIFNKIRGWCITLVSAISVGYLSDNIEVSSFEYIFLSIMIVLLFFFSEAIHRVAHMRAIERCGDIEEAIREEEAYDGPKIHATLVQGNKLMELSKVVKKPRLFVTYFSLVVIISVLGFGG